MCTVICLCFFSWYSLCWLYLAFPFSIITPFILNPSATSSFFSSLMLPLPFPFFCFWLDPSLPTCPSPQDPSALLLPLVPSQTNGAHYKLTKNSPAAKSIHFFFLSVFLSFSLPNAPIFFFFSVPPSGGKWVTEKRLVSSFISWQRAGLCAIRAERLRLWDRGPETGLMAVCLSWFLLYRHRA